MILRTFIAGRKEHADYFWVAIVLAFYADQSLLAAKNYGENISFPEKLFLKPKFPMAPENDLEGAR